MFYYISGPFELAVACCCCCTSNCPIYTFMFEESFVALKFAPRSTRTRTTTPMGPVVSVTAPLRAVETGESKNPIPLLVYSCKFCCICYCCCCLLASSCWKWSCLCVGLPAIVAAVETNFCCIWLESTSALRPIDCDWWCWCCGRCWFCCGCWAYATAATFLIWLSFMPIPFCRQTDACIFATAFVMFRAC